MTVPETRYAKTADGVHVAHQVVGTGPPDLVLILGVVSHLEHQWKHPEPARFFRRLASFSRLILLDKRGTGLSDRVSNDAIPDLETRMDDIRAVMDSVGSEKAVLVGESEAAATCALFAATYPERTLALVMIGGYARALWAPDYPLGESPERMQQRLEEIEQHWGERAYSDRVARDADPTMADDPEYLEWWAGFLRYGASPGAAVNILRMAYDIDIRHVLPAIRVPTLVMHRTLEAGAPDSRYMAERIPGAEMVELGGRDHSGWRTFESDDVAEAIERFVKQVNEEVELDRILATILFTDIAGSTDKAAELGDRRWAELLREHHARVRSQLSRYRGKEIDTAGDGFLATFDGPARAIRCATAIVSVVRDLGIDDLLPAGVDRLGRDFL